jgi:hypothetical protein
MRALTSEPVAAPRGRTLAWAVRGVLAPFVATRLGLLAAGWVAQVFPDRIPGGRGFTYFRGRAADLWVQWDADWYLRIALEGYAPARDPGGGQHNVAFFPGYPMLVRTVHALVPAGWQGPQAAALIALALANLFAVGALALLLLYARERLGDDAGAERSVVYLLAFPSAFFLSVAYSESLFLFLALATFLAARRGRWDLAALAGVGLGLSRPVGVALTVPLAWIYLEQRGWRWREVRRDVLFLGAPAVGFGLYALYLGWLTGDPLAMVRAQAGWGRHLADPWTTLFRAQGHRLMDLDRGAALLFVLPCAYLLASRRWRADGLVVLMLLASVLLSGRLLSSVRLLLPAFPAFILLADVARSRAIERSLLCAGLVLQAVLFVAWGLRFWLA